MLTARAEQIEYLARPMLIDPEQRIRCPPPERFHCAALRLTSASSMAATAASNANRVDVCRGG